MRAESGRVRYWRRHIEKLGHDCAALDIACPSESALRRDIERLLGQTPDCIVKISVIRGGGGRGYAAQPGSRSLRIVASFPASAERHDWFHNGVRIRWCRTALAIQPRLAGIKHLNRLENVLARSEWDDPDIAEGLMLDTEGHVIEGTFTNLFVLDAAGLTTPDLNNCGVAGVQRDRMFEMAARLGIRCRIEQLSMERVLASAQVLLVNSVIGLWWVSNCEGRRWGRNEMLDAITRGLDDLGD
jgi:4-amino-4-deoxychorismate lyase